MGKRQLLQLALLAVIECAGCHLPRSQTVGKNAVTYIATGVAHSPRSVRRARARTPASAPREQERVQTNKSRSQPQLTRMDTLFQTSITVKSVRLYSAQFQAHLDEHVVPNLQHVGVVLVDEVRSLSAAHSVEHV